ncbi:MAG TPA: trypsin-like peptidase domain-containing protein [Candidatus Acidoferrum sp.]|nr:trypsin-like peptidase domain-containing protein [Candidatus Acidoferrum sp.]
MTAPAIQRLHLPYKAVLVRCLDAEQRVLANASGFIRKEENELLLYTSWHVVTGYDRNELKVKDPPTRKFLSIEMQNADARQEGVTMVGGLQTFAIPLYDPASPTKPLWLQDKRHVPHPDLNAISIFVPFWHDAVKLLLPKNIQISDIQLINEDPTTTLLAPGDKLYVVGFPYGYSSHGAAQPAPVVLTRFVASNRIDGRHQEVLLESAGAPGMSGGPVFVDTERGIELLGLYTGLIYPDHVVEKNEKTTALGTCSDMTIHWHGHLPFVQTPDES